MSTVVKSITERVPTDHFSYPWERYLDGRIHKLSTAEVPHGQFQAFRNTAISVCRHRRFEIVEATQRGEHFYFQARPLAVNSKPKSRPVGRPKVTKA